MKKIGDYLLPSQLEDMRELSISEKLAATLKFINYLDPEVRFTCRDVSLFLEIKPQGLSSIARAIQKLDPDFPIQMIQKGYRHSNSKMHTFNKERVDGLSDSWKKK